MWPQIFLPYLKKAVALPIRSSALAWAVYVPASSVLTIGFTDGRQHSYSPVDADTVMGLAEAGSQGQYFNAVIRPLGTGRQLDNTNGECSRRELQKNTETEIVWTGMRRARLRGDRGLWPRGGKRGPPYPSCTNYYHYTKSGMIRPL